MTIARDAFWQILGRLLSAISGFLVTIMLIDMFGPLRYGDYNTLLSYFALWSALADLGLYVLALKEIGVLKQQHHIQSYQDIIDASQDVRDVISDQYSRFVISRVFQICVVYIIALGLAYIIPSYRENVYLVRGLPSAMIFSALFLVAGIIQLPLQLFWQMHHVTIALVVARVAQFGVLGALYIYMMQVGGWGDISVGVFLIGIGSLIVCGLAQALYTYIYANRIIPLRYVERRPQFISYISSNRQYGVAYFFSSFHLLFGSLCISIVYPTIAGFMYTGTRGLAMQLMQILLVIPASFANSLLHKVTHFSQTGQKKAFGNLMSLSIWIGLYITALFTIFGTWIISLIGGTKYLTAGYILDRTGITSVLAHSHPLSIVYGADYMLPFLGLVLLCSFIKTVYNYIFISLDKHNTLLRVNLGGFVVGAPITWYLVMHYHLIGAGIGQIIMEIAFVAFSMVYASRHHAIPIVSYRHIVVMSVYFVFVICLGLYIQSGYGLVVTSGLYRLIYMGFIAVLIALPRYGRVRSRLYLLSHDD